jgi:hypothetical protein
MPKKTKRQKILARQRRHVLSSLSTVTPSAQLPKTDDASQTFSFQLSPPPVKSVTTADDLEELTVIKRDLTKTLILAVIAVVIELGVYRMLHGT